MSFRNSIYRKIKLSIQVLLLTIAFLGILFLVFLLWTKYTVHNENVLEKQEPSTITSIQSFPIGVDPEKKVIVEDPMFSSYLESHLLVTNTTKQRQERFFDRLVSKLAQSNLYQQLASRSSSEAIIKASFSGTLSATFWLYLLKISPVNFSFIKKGSAKKVPGSHQDNWWKIMDTT